MVDTPATSSNALEFPEDVKEFLLVYPRIHASIAKARSEMVKVNEEIERVITNCPWFVAGDFVTTANEVVFQVWRRSWNSDVTPGCPWIHFEYNYFWHLCAAEASLDMEGARLVGWQTIQEAASRLAKHLRERTIPWLRGGGWVLDERLPGRRMLLRNRTAQYSRDTLSPKALVENAVARLGELAGLIGVIDGFVGEMGPRPSHA